MVGKILQKTRCRALLWRSDRKKHPMPKCIHHPDREAQMMCMKHQLYLCSDCLTCRDPTIYCKFRTACTIWFLDKEKRRESRPQPVAGAL
jgi:hypothetical protein